MMLQSWLAAPISRCQDDTGVAWLPCLDRVANINVQGMMTLLNTCITPPAPAQLPETQLAAEFRTTQCCCAQTMAHLPGRGPQ